MGLLDICSFVCSIIQQTFPGHLLNARKIQHGPAGPCHGLYAKEAKNAVREGRGGAGRGEAEGRGGEGREETDKLTTAITVPRLHPTELPISSVDLYESHSPRL